MRTILVLLAAGAYGADLNSLLAEARKLNEKDVDKLEEKFKDAEAHLKLAAYYTGKKSVADRGRHILWLIEKQPQHEAFSRFELRVFAEGPLADPAAFEKGKALWLAHRESKDKAILANAARWLSLGDPESAEPFYRKAQDQSGLGSLYANALLGLTALAPIGYDPAAASRARRESAFAKKALAAIESNDHPEFVSAAAYSLGQNGQFLFADGLIDWDYTPVLKPLLGRALRLDPDSFGLYTISFTLPERGDRPIPMIRIGGSVMAESLQRQVRPDYPETAKIKGIQGTIRFNVLVGRNGEMLRLRVVKGPLELVSAAHDAVMQWRYKPIMLNGKATFVVTQIDVSFVLD